MRKGSTKTTNKNTEVDAVVKLKKKTSPASSTPTTKNSKKKNASTTVSNRSNISDTNSKRGTVQTTKSKSSQTKGPDGRCVSKSKKTRKESDSSKQTAKSSRKTDKSKQRKITTAKSGTNKTATVRKGSAAKQSTPAAAAKNTKRIRGNQKKEPADDKGDRILQEGKKERRKRKKFSVTSDPLTNKTILSKPKDTGIFGLVDVIIDGEIWRVSTWSIRGNIYYQGLDSNFLVHYYRPSKK
jgi:hypothetical protein